MGYNISSIKANMSAQAAGEHLAAWIKPRLSKKLGKIEQYMDSVLREKPTMTTAEAMNAAKKGAVLAHSEAKTHAKDIKTLTKALLGAEAYDRLDKDMSSEADAALNGTSRTKAACAERKTLKEELAQVQRDLGEGCGYTDASSWHVHRMHRAQARAANFVRFAGEYRDMAHKLQLLQDKKAAPAAEPSF